MREHPFWRAFALAFALCAAITLLGSLNLETVYAAPLSDKPMLCFAAMCAFGALAASLPARLSRRGPVFAPASPRTCLVSFAGGLLLMFALHLAGAGETLLLQGVFEAAPGALAFALCAWLCAFAALRLKGRWAR